ncbi:M23 family metallopeptidase [Candidatus Omnitrophota bacterium]
MKLLWHQLFRFLIVLVISAVSSHAENLIWPIDAPHSITSSFGEPRPGRFHYGLDFRSGGVTGKKVFTLGDGYISRVRTSPFGYGKVLYITLKSGQILVYAHLSGFLPEIEKQLFEKRIEQKTYSVELWPKPNEFPVTKGQVIAYSGDTGGGAAHLHLEVRTKDNLPLNPLDYGIQARDTIPPEIQAVVFFPLDNESSVDGFPVERWYDPETLKSAAPSLHGRIGVAVPVWDRINNSRNKLGIYTISLDVDSTEVFSKYYKKISYNINHTGALDYLPGYRNGGNGYLSALFKRHGNKADFYTGDGILNTTTDELPGRHMLAIKADDHEKNTTVCSFPVVYGKPPAFEQCGYNGSDAIRITGNHSDGTIDNVVLWRYDNEKSWVIDRLFPVNNQRCDIEIPLPENPTAYKAFLNGEDSINSVPCYFGFHPQNADSTTNLKVMPELRHNSILVRIHSSAPISSLPVMHVEENGVIAGGFISTVPESDNSWIASLPLPDGNKTVMRIKASAFDQRLNTVWDIATISFTGAGLQETTTVVAPDSLFSVTIDPGSLYRPFPVSVDTVDTKEIQLSNSLKRVSKVYRVTFGDYPLKGAAKVRLIPDSEPPKGAALFSSSNGKTWNFESNHWDGTAFTGTAGSSGKLAVLRDTFVPYVKVLSPKPGRSIRNRRPLLKAFIEDKGSGIDSDIIVMSIDNIPVYGEYDYEAHTIMYRLRNTLSLGEHTVVLKVSDNVGNVKTRSWKFKIVK